MRVAVAGTETGWLLDNGFSCVGLGSYTAFYMVTYTSADAIRFARKEDAILMREVLLRLTKGNHHSYSVIEKTKPVEHAWG